jgi:hypothetical protein
MGTAYPETGKKKMGNVAAFSITCYSSKRDVLLFRLIVYSQKEKSDEQTHYEYHVVAAFCNHYAVCRSCRHHMGVVCG